MCIQGKKPAHFAAAVKPILAIAVSFFAVSRSRTSKRKQARTKQETKPMNIISLIIQLISGAVGGNVAGAAMKESSLGTLGNSIAGIVGGGLGGTILQMVMGTAAAGRGAV
jgi:uncharacterized membrane protein YeaQ/YmgE (transglycosylase-associated protein family)